MDSMRGSAKVTIVVVVSRSTGEEGRYSFPSEAKAGDFAEETSTLAKEAGTEISIRTMTEEEGLLERFDSLVDQWEIGGKTKRGVGGFGSTGR